MWHSLKVVKSKVGVSYSYTFVILLHTCTFTWQFSKSIALSTKKYSKVQQSISRIPFKNTPPWHEIELLPRGGIFERVRSYVFRERRRRENFGDLVPWFCRFPLRKRRLEGPESAKFSRLRRAQDIIIIISRFLELLTRGGYF